MSNIIENFEATGTHNTQNHIHIIDDILTKLIEYNDSKKLWGIYVKKEKYKGIRRKW